MKTNRQLEKIARVEPLVMDGQDWYNFREICEALGAMPERAGKLLIPEDVRLVRDAGRNGQRISRRYINRHGVFILAIRCGICGTRAAMDALQQSEGKEVH